MSKAKPKPVKRKWTTPASAALDAFKIKGVTTSAAVNILASLKENARKTVKRAEVEAFLDRMEAQEVEVFDAGCCGDPWFEPGVLVHPTFIREAARRGYTFFVDSRGQVCRYTISKEGVDYAERAPDVDLSTVDLDFYYEPEWFKDLQGFIEAGQRVLLIGPAGTGKSEAVERIFRAREQQLLVVSCNPSMTADDFEGCTDLRESEGGTTVTEFTPAAPAVALEKGYGLLLDEVDAVSPEACFALYRILDGRSMHILRKGYEGSIEANKAFRCVGTQNTEGRGDDRGLFHGRAFQDEAMLDRWSVYIRTDYPLEEVETTILVKRTGIERKHAEQVVECASLMRKALQADKMLMSVSLRRTQNVCANLVAGMPRLKAWEFAVSNRATSEDATSIEEMVKRVYGSKASAPIVRS